MDTSHKEHLQRILDMRRRRGVLGLNAYHSGSEDTEMKRNQAQECLRGSGTCLAPVSHEAPALELNGTVLDNAAGPTRNENATTVSEDSPLPKGVSAHSMPVASRAHPYDSPRWGVKYAGVSFDEAASPVDGCFGGTTNADGETYRYRRSCAMPDNSGNSSFLSRIGQTPRHWQELPFRKCAGRYRPAVEHQRLSSPSRVPAIAYGLLSTSLDSTPTRRWSFSAGRAGPSCTRAYSPPPRRCSLHDNRNYCWNLPLVTTATPRKDWDAAHIVEDADRLPQPGSHSARQRGRHEHRRRDVGSDGKGASRLYKDHMEWGRRSPHPAESLENCFLSSSTNSPSGRLRTRSEGAPGTPVRFPLGRLSSSVLPSHTVVMRDASRAEKVLIPCGGQAIRPPDAYSTMDLRSSVKMLAGGDWFYKWSQHRHEVRIRWIWVDTKNYLLVWSHKQTTESAFSGSLKLEHIYDVTPHQLFQPGSDGQPKTFYVLLIVTTKRTLQLATERPEKANGWFEALSNLLCFVKQRRKGHMRRLGAG